MTEFWILVGFHAFIAAMLALDLGIFRRQAKTVSMKEAAIWSVVWISLAFLFAFGIWQYWHLWHPDQPDAGGIKAIEFITGYLVEQSLSVDNLFVFLVIFRYFAVPEHLRHRVLVWGILGAVLMRATFIVLGTALLHYLHFTIYFFAVAILYTAWKLFHSVEADIDPEKNLLFRLARKFFPVIDNYDSPRFWVKREGRWHATPLPLVLLVIESTDVVFAVDSIPAIFGITKDPFIVYTSNIFAILGLRSLYFLLSGFLGMFRYLSVGLALVLTFVGIKMLVEEPLTPYLESHGIGRGEMILISLGTIAVILFGAVIASIIAGPKEPLEHPPEAATDIQPATETPPASSPVADAPRAPQ